MNIFAYLLYLFSRSEQKMNKSNCKSCIHSSWGYCVIPLALFGGLSLLIGISERRKLYTYVETECLLKNSSLEKCATSDSGKNAPECFQLRWRIKYIRYSTNKESTIIFTVHYSKGSTDSMDYLIKRLEKYQVLELDCEE